MGTIVDKFNYSFEAKDLIKDSINNLGGSITSETELKEYAQELQDIYNNIPKTTDTGTNLSLTTLKGKMNTTLKGDTQQTQYSGYNKMNTANATIGYKPEGTITIDSKGVINASTNMGYVSINLPSMTLSSGITYIFKRNFTGSYNSSLVDTNGDTIVAIGYNRTSVTLTPESDITINKLNGALVSGDNYFWLYEGTTDKNFEPYVGGTASPNPTYPQNIEVVTGTQEVKVENKNLLPTPYVYDSRTINGITFTINNDYSISVSGTATGNATFVLLNETSSKLEDIRKLLLNNSCTLSGCPTGGSSSSYRLQLYGRGSAGTGTSVDYGSGVAITNFENTSNNFNIAIFIPSGTTISTPIIFKPQLEKRKCSNNIYTTPRTNSNSRII